MWDDSARDWRYVTPARLVSRRGLVSEDAEDTAQFVCRALGYAGVYQVITYPGLGLGLGLGLYSPNTNPDPNLTALGYAGVYQVIDSDFVYG
jgi:hypothetical protein